MESQSGIVFFIVSLGFLCLMNYGCYGNLERLKVISLAGASAKTPLLYGLLTNMLIALFFDDQAVRMLDNQQIFYRY